MSKRWYVGTTKEQQELVAAQHLRNQGYSVYLPKVYIRHQDGRKIEARAHLRFTGYIFIALDITKDEHGPISNTRGMDGSEGSALVCAGGGGLPVAMAPGIVDALRKIEDEDLARAVARKTPKPRTDLTPGDWVQINRPDDPSRHNLKGVYFGTEKGWAEVMIGLRSVQVAEIDLKKIEEKRAA